MSDSEPISSKNIDFITPTSHETHQDTIPQALTELRQQLIQKDLLWIKYQQEYFVQQIRDTQPHLQAPTRFGFSERSLYGIAFDGFAVTATISEWELSGGHSLQQLGFLTPIRSNNQIIEYKSNKNTPQDWDIARETVLNDTFFKRHQELGDAIKALNPTKTDKYPLNFYLDPNRPEDKAIFNKYQQNQLKFQETELGWQPILDLSSPPGNEFLFTPTAVDLFTTLEKTHLQLSDHLKQELIDRSEQRYGNSYVTLGREIAKLVSDTSRDISKLFLVGEDSSEIWKKIDSLEIPDDPAAALLIKMIKQVRQSTSSLSDLPISSEKVSFKAGTCKDLETYFSNSINEYSAYTVNISGKRFLKEGSHHSDVNHMIINLEPIVFNGITLSPGNLFRDDYKGGFHYMRPTAFCFDQNFADEVFGEEYRKSIRGWKAPDKIFDLFSPLIHQAT